MKEITTRKMSAANRMTLAAGIIIKIKEELNRLKEEYLQSPEYLESKAIFEAQLKKNLETVSIEWDHICNLLKEAQDNLQVIKNISTETLNKYNVRINTPYTRFTTQEKSEYDLKGNLEAVLRQFENNKLSNSDVPKIAYGKEDNLRLQIENDILMSEDQDPKNLFDTLYKKYIEQLKNSNG